MRSTVLLLLVCAITLSAAIEGNIREGDVNHVPTTHTAVELLPGVDPDQVALAHGYVNLGPVGTLKNIYLFHKEERKRSVDEEDHPHISTSPDVTWFEKQVGRMRFKRVSISDPLYASQWHLKNSNGIDVNVNPAWDMGVSGKGITIGVVDDGLQRQHPDISNYNAEGSTDENEGDRDPTPHYGDDHGTSAAGVAAASRGNVCGVGPAFDSGLSGIRLISDYTTDAQEARGLSFANQINDIYTNSWGPNDDGRRLEGPGSLTLRAMEETSRLGRNGKGSIYVWAGGNGRAAGDNCNYDGYANSRFAITIGAVDYMGKQSYYSENCAKLLACAPSSGSSRSVTTTDLLGASGSSRTDCTSTFGGTSAAAPLVAGVVALILEANTNLGWRDVQNIIVNTSKKVDGGDGDWWTNGAGHQHNHKYGFGLVDAGAAVAMAKSYTNLPVSVSVEKQASVGKPLYDFQPVENTIEITDSLTVEAVEVVLVAPHQYRGDLVIILTSPFGTKSVLQEVHNDRSSGINWMYSTVRCWGENSVGGWTLRVVDSRAGSVGTFDNWKLRIWGH